jgi:cell division protein FtsZ
MPTISAASLTGQADPIAVNDPIAVALDLSGIEDTAEVSIPAPAAARRRVTFEELVSEDEIDVPDFMK